MCLGLHCVKFCGISVESVEGCQSTQLSKCPPLFTQEEAMKLVCPSSCERSTIWVSESEKLQLCWTLTIREQLLIPCENVIKLFIRG